MVFKFLDIFYTFLAATLRRNKRIKEPPLYQLVKFLDERFLYLVFFVDVVFCEFSIVILSLTWTS